MLGRPEKKTSYLCNCVKDVVSEQTVLSWGPEHGLTSSDLSSVNGMCKVGDGGNSVIVSFCPANLLLSIIN